MDEGIAHTPLGRQPHDCLVFPRIPVMELGPGELYLGYIQMKYPCASVIHWLRHVPILRAKLRRYPHTLGLRWDYWVPDDLWESYK